MELSLDPNDLTIGDLEDFEQVAGSDFFEVLKARDTDGRTHFTAKELKALVWIVGRRQNPDMTLDDARNQRITDLQVNVETRPTEAACSS